MSNEQSRDLKNKLRVMEDAQPHEVKQSDEERKKPDSQLIQASKMEAMETLANGIAHDFNNILSGIVGYSEVALLIAEKDKQVSNILNKILDTCERAKFLINQILSFSRQNYGLYDDEPVHVEPIISEVIRLLRVSLPENIEIKVNINNDTGLIKASPSMIRQVIMNICTNAVQAMKENGGVLSIDLSSVKIDMNSDLPNAAVIPGYYVKLIISDNGSGISDEIMGRIFDPYFTTKEKGEGTGLGLSVVHGIIKNYKGSISVSSKPDIKTSFEILLPLMVIPGSNN